jgi:hypothetical protein
MKSPSYDSRTSLVFCARIGWSLAKDWRLASRRGAMGLTLIGRVLVAAEEFVETTGTRSTLIKLQRLRQVGIAVLKGGCRKVTSREDQSFRPAFHLQKKS